eukprot:6209693-Pleurochrysis_carterae.AAC.1
MEPASGGPRLPCDPTSFSNFGYAIAAHGARPSLREWGERSGYARNPVKLATHRLPGYPLLEEWHAPCRAWRGHAVVRVPDAPASGDCRLYPTASAVGRPPCSSPSSGPSLPIWVPCFRRPFVRRASHSTVDNCSRGHAASHCDRQP